MTGKHSRLAIALLLLAPCQLLADPPIVNIQIRPASGQGPARIEVEPHAAAVCWGTQNCPTELTYRWIGKPPGQETQRIQVAYKPGIYWQGETPITVDPKLCLSFPNDETTFELEHGTINGRKVALRQDEAACKVEGALLTKVFYFYDIRCIGGEGNNCGGVEPLDPGTLIDNGRR